MFVKRTGNTVIHHTATTQQTLQQFREKCWEMTPNNHHLPICNAPVQLTHQQLGIQTNVFIRSMLVCSTRAPVYPR